MTSYGWGRDPVDPTPQDPTDYGYGYAGVTIDPATGGVVTQQASLPTATKGSIYVDRTDGSDAEPTLQEQVDQFFASRGIDLESSGITDSSNMILQALASAGVDTSIPEVQEFAEDPVATKAFNDSLSGGTAWTPIVQSLATQFPSGTQSQYGAATTQLFGVSGPPAFHAPMGTPSVNAGQEDAQLKAGNFLGQNAEETAASNNQGAYYTNPSNGAIVYRNGVIMDPQTGSVYYPPDEKIAGSPVWMNKIRSSWSDGRIMEEKALLVKYGYLPKGSQKHADWDLSFQNGLTAFYNSKYSNYGKPVVADTGAGGYAGPGGTGSTSTFSNLRQVHATIQSDIISQYHTLFQRDPSDAELAKWTSFVISQGNKLQRGANGLSAGSAATEAENRALHTWRQTPEFGYRQDQEENTSLRDGIVGAVQASQAVMGGMG